MSQFELYTPSAWVENGMILPVKGSSRVVDTKKVRRGNWSSVITMIALCTIATTTALPISPIPLGTTSDEIVISDAENTPFLHYESQYLVPAGYWDRLDVAIASVTRLPNQDISRDPPVMV